MNGFLDFLSNRFLITALSSWFIAQILKLIIHAIIHKKINLGILISDGGMPSGHSATVTSLATICGYVCGFDSIYFAITLVLAVIVCHDATGVRQETGKQTVIINEIVKAFNDLSADGLPETKLKEFVGHTPIQVTAGIAIGVLNATIMHFWVL